MKTLDHMYYLLLLFLFIFNCNTQTVQTTVNGSNATTFTTLANNVSFTGAGNVTNVDSTVNFESSTSNGSVIKAANSTTNISLISAGNVTNKNSTVNFGSFTYNSSVIKVANSTTNVSLISAGNVTNKDLTVNFKSPIYNNSVIKVANSTTNVSLISAGKATNNDSLVNIRNSTYNGSIIDIGNDTSSSFDNDTSEDLADASNIHFHLTVPRYYSPYEELPFLYFVNSSTTIYTNQKKYYFNLHMGSSPFTPTYGLLVTNVSSGSYTFHIGRAYNQTWVADAVNASDNSTFTQTIDVTDAYTTISYEINVEVWSDFYGEKFFQSPNSSLDRIFLLRARYKSISCDIKRRIWMYLPPDYETATTKRYPVVYAHWGQLMFNYYGNDNEWGLDRLLTNAFNNDSSCDILKWGVIVVAIEALPTKFLSNTEYIVSREESGCHSKNLIRTFSGSFKRHIHANFRTLNQWNYTTMLGYGTAGGLIFDVMTKYFQKFGKFIILSWILDEPCCESEVEISDALTTSKLFRGGLHKNTTNSTRRNRLFPKIFFTWTSDEEPAEITRARDNAKGLKHRGLPISNIYVDPVNNTNATAQFYGAQTMKALCWLFNNQSAESFSDTAPWWDEEQLSERNNQTNTTVSQK